MKESLESARNIHQILIVVCTIVSVFAFSLRPEMNKYEIALRELRGIEAAFHDVNIARAERIEKRILGGLPKGSFDFLIDSAYKYKTIKTLKSELTPMWNELDSTNFIYAENDNLKKLSVENKHMEMRGLALTPASNSDLWKWERDYYPDCDYLRACKNKMYYAHVGTADSLFANITPVWLDIKDMPWEDAKQRLVELSSADREKSKGDVDLSGLKVAGEQMYLIGPGAIIVLLSYLLTLVLHIGRILTLKEDAILASSFPWLALFPNSYSHLLSIFSLVIFPILASGFIVSKSGLPTEISDKIIIIYSILFFILSPSVAYKTVMLQFKIRKLLR
ncbi:hypothetical protein Dfri01_55800 [Dyadobacter frigoris]|uniref:hypothetical protein n=1 Tax=Dyadobacter frigoris TaxID=2576211 RepID=UPI0024A096B9|nr:hypothetical protein [Dyadobacter frigoris]GLU56119.1 hypothetical protein Dfri01_55800 [Dyadobacter frigoris]